MPGIYVYFVNDQINILDEHHTRIDFDTVLYDTDSEWDATTLTWRPQITTPKLCRLDAHVSWTTPSGASGVGYAKIWAHVKNANNANFNRQLGEGRRDGPLSAANPGINYSSQYLLQPGDNIHLVFMGFSGANGHAIQSGSDDDADGTPQRSFFAASY